MTTEPIRCARCGCTRRNAETYARVDRALLASGATVTRRLILAPSCVCLPARDGGGG